jgi:transposase-like protein
MGQILHGSRARDPSCDPAIESSARRIAARHGLNRGTVAKWRKRTFVHDAPMGPKVPCSTVLSPEEEAIVVAFRKHMSLALDDCLYALQATIPHLTRSSLHRCLRRHGICRLPEITGDKTIRKPFKRYPIGYFHIDIAEVRTEEGKLYLFVAVDRTSKYAFAQHMPKATAREARAFLAALVARCRMRSTPRSPTTAFSSPICCPEGPTARWRGHPFDRACRSHGIEHRLSQPNYPWTNGQVERMNRTLKEATVRRYHYEDHQQLRDHLAAFLDAYNFAKQLKTLQGFTPYERTAKLGRTTPSDSDTIQSTSHRD